jgi:uncharacterized protein YjbI with pentapeptide repeats
VDERIRNYQTIVAAVRDDVRCIVYDVEDASYPSIIDYIKAKISQLNLSSFTTFGIVEYNQNRDYYNFFGSQPSLITSVIYSEPNLESWSHVKEFISYLKTTYSVQTYDMLACALYINENWKYVIDSISASTGVQVRASTDKTGSFLLGGDWVLESTGTDIDLKTVYFTENIENFNDVLDITGTVVTSKPTPSISTFGQGNGEFLWPRSCRIYNNRIYVSDTNNSRVQIFDLSLNYVSKFENRIGSSLYDVGDIVIHPTNGRIYISGSHRINAFDASFNYLFSSPTASNIRAIAMDVSGFIYGSLGFEIRKYDASCNFVGTYINRNGSGDGQLNNASGMIFDSSNNLWITDEGPWNSPLNHRVQKFDISGNFLMKFGSAGSGDSSFNIPYYPTLDSEGNVYVPDFRNDRLKKFTNDGTFLMSFGGTTSPSDYNRPEAGKLDGPIGVAVDTSGNVYVIEHYNQRLQKFNSAGVSIGTRSALTTGTSNALGSFNEPWGIAAHPSNGNIYVVDRVNNRVQKFDASFSFVLSFGSTGSGDSSFNSPRRVAIDPSENIYITDTTNHAVKVFNSSGSFLRRIGTGFGNGNGQFNTPIGIVVDTSFNVYISDINERVQMFNSAGTYVQSYTIGQRVSGMSMDASRNLYVVSSSNVNSIYKYSTATSGTISPIMQLNSQGTNITDISVDLNTNNFITVQTSSTPRFKMYDVSGTLIFSSDLTVNSGQGVFLYNNSATLVYTDTYTHAIRQAVLTVPVVPTYQSISQVSKTFGVDASFSLTSIMTGISNSNGAYTFSSESNAITIVGGVATINAYTPSAITVSVSQAAATDYLAGSTSFTVLINRGTPVYQSISQVSKTFGVDASFSLAAVVAGVSTSSSAYTFTSADASGAISIVGDVAIIQTYTPSAITVTASQDASGNYNAGSTTFTVLINRGTPVYQSISQVSKTFGVDVSFSLAAVVAGVSNSNGAYTFTSTDANGAITIVDDVATIVAYTPSAITVTASQAASGNYAASSTTFTVLVNRGAPTYQSISQVTKTFSVDPSFSLTAVMTGVSNSNGAYSFSSDSAAISIAGGVATINAYTPSAATITASQDASGNYAASSTTFTVLVNRKVPSYGAFSIPAATYGDASFSIAAYAPTTDSTAVPFTYTSSDTAVATISSDGTVVTIIGQGYTTITASQDASGNYDAGSATTSFLVNRAAPTFLRAFTIPNKTYGVDVSFSLLALTDGLDNTDGTYHFTSSNTEIVSISGDGDTATIIGYTPSTPVTIYVAIDACGNYASATTSGTVSIARGTPTYQSISQVSKTFGDAAFSLSDIVAGVSNSNGAYTFTSSDASAVSIGGVNNDTATILAYTPTAITITASQAASGNYGASSTTISVLVNRLVPTLGAFTLGALNGYYEVSNGTFALTAPSSNSSGAFTYSSSNTSVAVVENSSTIRIIGNGNSTITATQDICGNYSSTSTTALLRVGATVPTFGTFTVSSVTRTYGDAPFTLTPPTSNSNGAFSFSSSDTSIISIAGTTATIVNAGTVSITVSQDPSGSFTRRSLSQSFTVQKKSPNMRNWPATFTYTYSDGSFNLTVPDTDNSGGQIYYYASGGNINKIAINGSYSTNVLILDGGSEMIFADQAESQNFLFQRISSTVIITPSPPISTYANFSRAFDVGTFLIPTPTTNSSLSGITYTSSDTSVATISDNMATVRKVGTTIITARIAANSKYQEMDISAVLTVTKGTPTMTGAGVSNSSLAITSAPYVPIASSTSNGTFTYVSDNSGVILVTNNNTIQPVSLGTANITATIGEDTSGNYNSRSITYTITVVRGTSSLSSSTLVVPNSMTYGDAPANLVVTPTSNNTATPIVYTSSNTSVATIDPSSGVITAQGAGTAMFSAYQVQTSIYNYNAISSSNYLTVNRMVVPLTKTGLYTGSTISKNYGDSSFQLSATSISTGSIFYYANVGGIVTISNSGVAGTVSIVGVGTVTITGYQVTNSRYTPQNEVVYTLTVGKGTTTLNGLDATLTKNVTDVPFYVSAVSASAGALTYSLANPADTSVLTVNSSTGLVTLKGAGTATVVVSQAMTALYHAPASVSCVITVNQAGSALQGATLSSDRVFTDVDMSGASLTNSTITNVSFSGATLTNAVMTNSTVRNAVMTSATLAGASFASSDISGTNFTSATLTSANMANTILTNSVMTNAVLTGAAMNNATITRTTFTGATVRSANLTGATLTDSTLTSVDLSGSILRAANVAGSTFVGAVLANADLSGAVVTNANFTNANIRGANITNVNFSPLQKLQLLKNTNNRDIGGVQISDVSGSVLLSAISATSAALTIPDISNATIKVVVPTTSTNSGDTIQNVTLDTTSSDKFYFPINTDEYFQIEGVKYYVSNGVIKRQSDNETVSVVTYGNRRIWLIAGSVIASVLQTNTISSSTFTVPSYKLDSDAPFSITVAPTSNSPATIVYSSNNPSVATIDPSSGLITIHKQGYVNFIATQSETQLYESGSKMSNELFVNKLINFTLTGLNQAFIMNALASLDASSVSIENTDAVAVYYVKQSDMMNVFKFQSDSNDLNDISASDVKYYVFDRNWPTELKINPLHAMMNKTESANMLGNAESFAANKMLVKHDFIRYLSLCLFNTIHGVDLFRNESDLLENAVYGGETNRNTIHELLGNVSTTSSDESLSYDASGNKYLTNDVSGNTNLCRELLRQMVAGAPARFGSITDANTPQSLPFEPDDTINFKLTLEAAPTQNVLTGVSVIPSRSYLIKLVIKSSVTGGDANTAVVDSEMYPNAYPYSSSVVSYAPTSASSSVYNSYSPPAPIPFSRYGFNGWYYANSSAWVNVSSSVRNRVKWMVSANQAGSSTVGGLQYIRVNLKIHNKTALPYLMVYTQSGSYRKYAVLGGSGALTNGTKYSFYMNFNSYTREPAVVGYTNAALTNTVGTGSFANNEIISSIALETDSSATAGSVEFTLAGIVVGDIVSGVTGEKEYGFLADVPVAYP